MAETPDAMSLLIFYYSIFTTDLSDLVSRAEWPFGNGTGVLWGGYRPDFLVAHVFKPLTAKGAKKGRKGREEELLGRGGGRT